MKKKNVQRLKRDVSCYKMALSGIGPGRLVFATFPVSNKEAFFSIAPLSLAVHELGGDMHVIGHDNDTKNIAILKNVWQMNELFKAGKCDKQTKALAELITLVESQSKNKKFSEIFAKPELMFSAGKDGFEGPVSLRYSGWHSGSYEKGLGSAAKRILTEGYALDGKDTLSVGFCLVPKESKEELPLCDYLDSYQIAYSFIEASKKIGAENGMNAYSARKSMLEAPVRSADLLMTLYGLELDSEIDEKIFRKYRELARLCNIGHLVYPTAVFSIHGKGYFGHHNFGEEIGYPTKNKKSRWTSPTRMMLKDRFEPQSLHESRDPMMRYGITETIPQKTFVETCNISYNRLRKRNEKIRDKLEGCEEIRVFGRKTGGHATDLSINLKRPDGMVREFITSDCDVRSIIDKEYMKKTGLRTGMFANFPSGEAFVTPERVTGTMVGDVVINIDRSYRLSEEKPLVVRFDGKGRYSIVRSHPPVKGVIERETEENKKKIKNYERSGAIPKELIEMYKENFYSCGEFAINTNPKARLSDYLIVNEKIANMIHLALGMGFDPDKKTTYHWDIVINAPRQRLTIFGIDREKKKHYVMKEGKGLF